jgi:zinc/manganese transport system substrate-binding protein
MLDPRRAAAVARGIAARLKQLDAAGASAYDARLAQFLQRLSDVQRRIEADLRTLRGAKVIGYHRSFPYLADWLGLTIVDHLEPRPGIPPNPQHVSHVLSTARREGVRILLKESWFPSTTAELVAARAGARVVRIPGGPDFRAGETYASFLQKIAARLRGT